MSTGATFLDYVTEPTKYYTVEGTNVFFRFLKDGVPVDALDFLGEAGWITPVSSYLCPRINPVMDAQGRDSVRQ